MSLPRGDIRIGKSEPALGALPGTNPQFAVNIGPRRSASVRRKAGDLLDMIGGNHLAAEVRDSFLHRLLPAGGESVLPRPTFRRRVNAEWAAAYGFDNINDSLSWTIPKGVSSWRS